MLRAVFCAVRFPRSGRRTPDLRYSQIVIAGKSSSESQGWFDPRVNGGRFLDVRPRSNDVDGSR
jgi:hypothetical protein